jgi:RNA polymerase sigma-70 factor (ECF subfamily)
MDKNEFARRVIEAEPTLYHISKSILKNEFDCADAVQEAILKAFSNLAKLREEQFFKTWLCRILIRECYKIAKSRSYTVPFEEEYMNGSNYQHKDIGLYKAIMQLNKKQRLTVTLHYVEGFSVVETAKILKIPEGTVKSRLSKAREQLKTLLNEEDYPDEYKENKEYIPQNVGLFS